MGGEEALARCAAPSAGVGWADASTSCMVSPIGKAPKVGLIIPSPRAPVSAEAAALYPEVAVCTAELGLSSMTIRGYEEAMERLVPVARRLAGEGVDGISVMGTSLTFFRGEAYNSTIEREVSRASGLPTTTMSTAIVRGLRALDVSRVIAVTAYTEEVDRRLGIFLEESGFRVVSVTGLGLTSLDAPGAVGSPALLRLVLDACLAARGDMDGVLISCGGLRALEVVQPIEDALDLPVVSSDLAGLWDVVGLIGASHPVEGYGRLLAGWWQAGAATGCGPAPPGAGGREA